jgi:hypothetical protein
MPEAVQDVGHGAIDRTQHRLAFPMARTEIAARRAKAVAAGNTCRSGKIDCVTIAQVVANIKGF